MVSNAMNLIRKTSMTDEFATSSISVEHVEATFSAFLPDLRSRQVVLRQLIQSADFAASIAPEAWGVTLWPNQLRLNVGRVEVLVVREDRVLLNCAGQAGESPFIGPNFRSATYKSVPDPKCAFEGTIEKFAKLADELQPHHRRFIELVGRKKSGDPVSGSSLAPGDRQPVIAFARRFLAIDLSQDTRIVLPPVMAQDLAYILDRDVNRSLQDSAVARRNRLQNAPKKPEEIQVTTRAFRRNADVIAEVLLRAQGRCERCKANAPFLKEKDGSPFLEVHHTKQLSMGGDDTVENALALCPNCHREMHFGLPKVSL